MDVYAGLDLNTHSYLNREVDITTTSLLFMYDFE